MRDRFSQYAYNKMYVQFKHDFKKVSKASRSP